MNTAIAITAIIAAVVVINIIVAAVRDIAQAKHARNTDDQAVARVRRVIAERRTEVAEREPDGMLPLGTPGASWCDAVTVTCDRIEDALRTPAPSQGIREQS